MSSEPIITNFPDHWESLTLGELCERGGGHIQTGPFGSQLHASDYVDVGIPSIMPINIGNNRIIEDDIARVSEEDAERLRKHRVLPGDIVYSRRGDVERRALVREEQRGWLCGTGCLKIHFGSGPVISEFASFYLGHPAVRSWIVRHAVGATMPNLNTKILSSVPFLLPPLDEQKAIASILVDLEDNIELNRTMNETLEEMARAIFKSWFVDFDPVRAKMDGREPFGLDAETAALFPSEFEDSKLGKIPKGWRVKSLGEVCENASVSFDFSRVETVVFINTGDVLEGRFLHEDRREKDGLPGQAKKSIQPDDILMTEIRPANKRFAYVDFDSANHVVSTKFMVIRSFEDTGSLFLYQFLTSSKTLNELQVLAESRSGTFPQITFDSIKHLEFVFPPRELQQKFLNLLEPNRSLIESNLSESKVLAEIRDLLLPKLLSGEIALATESDGKEPRLSESALEQAVA